MDFLQHSQYSLLANSLFIVYFSSVIFCSALGMLYTDQSHKTHNTLGEIHLDYSIYYH